MRRLKKANQRKKNSKGKEKKRRKKIKNYQEWPEIGTTDFIL